MQLKAISDRPLTLDWNITYRCQRYCSHCFVRERSIEPELPVSVCRQILRQFADFCSEYGYSGGVTFTGGDPLLYRGLMDLVSQCAAQGMPVVVECNPHLLSAHRLSTLKELGIQRIQFGLEGLAQFTDLVRGKGAFEQAAHMIEWLKNSGVGSRVHMTVLSGNIREIVPLLKRCSQARIDEFSWSRWVPISSSTKLGIDPGLYREVLISVLYAIRSLEQNEASIKVISSEPLLNLLLSEIGLLELSGEGSEVGCGQLGAPIGFRVLSLDPDGTMYPSRFSRIAVGKLPHDSFESIWNRDVMTKLRDIRNYTKCRDCYLARICRGFPEAAAVSGDIFASDPQCWRLPGSVPPA